MLTSPLLLHLLLALQLHAHEPQDYAQQQSTPVLAQWRRPAAILSVAAEVQLLLAVWPTAPDASALQHEHGAPGRIGSVNSTSEGACEQYMELEIALPTRVLMLLSQIVAG